MISSFEIRHTSEPKESMAFDLEDLFNAAMIISALTLHCFTVLHSLALRNITYLSKTIFMSKYADVVIIVYKPSSAQQPFAHAEIRD